MPKLTSELIADLDWTKTGGLLPAVVQHADSREVLMLGYMNQASLEATMQSGFVTFYSRSRQKLWRKGETSGHTLSLCDIAFDCDKDSLLVQAKPQGPTCHLGTSSCFGEAAATGTAFLDHLWAVIEQRAAQKAPGSSYTRKLLDAGVLRQAQKVGEEGVEVALAAAAQDDEKLLGEAADLTYHLLVLLKGRGVSMQQMLAVLAKRHQ